MNPWLTIYFCTSKLTMQLTSRTVARWKSLSWEPVRSGCWADRPEAIRRQSAARLRRSNGPSSWRHVRWGSPEGWNMKCYAMKTRWPWCTTNINSHLGNMWSFNSFFTWSTRMTVEFQYLICKFIWVGGIWRVAWTFPASFDLSKRWSKHHWGMDIPKWQLWTYGQHDMFFW